MVAARSYNKRRYLVAFLITAITFTLGLLLGSFLSSERVELISKASEQQKLEFESLQVQSLFLTTQATEKNCNSILTALGQSLDRLERTRSKLESYIADGKVEDYDALKRDYMLAEIRYWFLAKETRELCKDDRAAILYFYSNEEYICNKCGTQGLILTSLKEEHTDQILIFSIDGDYENEPMIKILKEFYDIKGYPSLIINEKTYEGLQEREQIEQIIAKRNKDDH